MKVGKTFYAKDRQTWRRWLEKNHAKAKEIWLVYYRKEAGRPRVPYNDAVEEALCFGWIDSILKRVDDQRFAQRFSPRRPNSVLSPMNLERVRRLIKARKMTDAGLRSLERHLDKVRAPAKGRLRPEQIPPDIRRALQADSVTWKNFRSFPGSYQRIRVGWVDMARRRPAEFKKRLAYFLKMTAQNKRYGMVQ